MTDTQRTVAVVGAGVAGLVTAYCLLQAGLRVTIYDKNSPADAGHCSRTAAGMLAPYCELETAEPDIAALGRQSLTLWPDILETIGAPDALTTTGSLVVAHRQDLSDLTRFRQQLRRKAPDYRQKTVDADGISRLEPALAGRFHQGLHLPEEATIDPRRALAALAGYLRAQGVDMRFDINVTNMEHSGVTVDGQSEQHDCVVDCRGLAAAADFQDLRGVKGEAVLVRTDGVTLTRPVRVMHPRYPLYVVPRADNHFLIGATTVESENRSVSVQSVLELLSAAYALHPAFGDAQVVETLADLRPAFPDHKPRLLQSNAGPVRINGLYRHGYLLAPALAAQVAERLTQMAEIA